MLERGEGIRRQWRFVKPKTAFRRVRSRRNAAIDGLTHAMAQFLQMRRGIFGEPAPSWDTGASWRYFEKYAWRNPVFG